MHATYAHVPHACESPLPLRRQQSYNDLKKLFEMHTTNAHVPHACETPLPLQRQQSYNDLKKLFEEASRVDPNWDKVFFQYARCV